MTEDHIAEEVSTLEEGTPLAELAELEESEREISAQRVRLHERIDRFPTEKLLQDEREISDRRNELHRRIDGLRAALGLPSARPESRAEEDVPGVDAVTGLEPAGPDTRTPLATVLVESGVVEKEQIDEALRLGSVTGERLGETLMRLGWASEDDLARALAEQWHLPFLERSAMWFDPQALTRLSREDANHLQAVPLLVNDNGAVTIAIAEPAESRLLALRSLLGDRIDFVVIPKTPLDLALRGDLLPSSGRQSMTDLNTTDEPVAESAEPVTFDVESIPALVVDDEPAAPSADPIAETRAFDFDDLARALNAAVGEQLTSMRAIVVDAEAARDRDRQELERLQAELAQRDELLAERDRTIATMRDGLRAFVDTF